MPRVRRICFEILIAICLMSLLFQASRSVGHLAERKRRLEVLYLPSGCFLNQAALGYRDLAADVLWFKTVQYYGGYRLGENDIALFSHLIDVITDLDPNFVFAYVFGALIMAEDLGCFEEGIELLKKGMWNNPTEWWFPYEIGFLYYVDARDFGTAVRYFRLASRLPGAEEIAGRFAAFVAAKAGYIETSIAMWEELARKSEHEYIRDLARRYIEKLRERSADEKAGGA